MPVDNLRLEDEVEVDLHHGVNDEVEVDLQDVDVDLVQDHHRIHLEAEVTAPAVEVTAAEVQVQNKITLFSFTMQVYIAPRQSNVNSMTLIDPEHSSWDQIKLLLAAKAYPDDIVPCASDVRVYLSPYDQNLEQDGVENAIKFLPAHCVVRVEIVSPSILNSREARTPSITSESTGSSSSSASSVSEEEEPEPRNHLREQIDKIVVGYAMTAQNDYKNRLVTIRNQFLDSKLIERRQFDLVNHDEATCMLCPVALRPDPSSDVAKLQDHARTRWHMRYLTFVKDQDCLPSVFSLAGTIRVGISSRTTSGFEFTACSRPESTTTCVAVRTPSILCGIS